jgi:hypothetical protein
MDLGEGQIDVKAHAHAEVFCGSVSVDVPMSLQPFIGAGNSIQPGQIKKGEPSSHVDADLICKAAIGIASAFLIGPLIGSVIAIIGVTVAESLAEGLVNRKILEEDLPAPQMDGSAPDLPPTRCPSYTKRHRGQRSRCPKAAMRSAASARSSPPTR